MRTLAGVLFVTFWVITSAGCGASTAATTAPATVVTTTVPVTTTPSTAVTTTTAATTTTSSTTTTTTIPATLTYEDPNFHFSFQYPSDFEWATPGFSLRTPGGGYVFVLGPPSWIIEDQASCAGLAAFALEGVRETDPEAALESATYYVTPAGLGMCKWVTIAGDGAVSADYQFNGPGGPPWTTVGLAVSGGTGEDSRTLFDDIVDTIRFQ